MNGSVPKIDVHADYLPAAYRQALADNGQEAPDGFPFVPPWSPEAHLEMMDDIGIGTSMLSISSPGVTFTGNPVEWARLVNEEGAATVRRYPERFGLFATLPLPDAAAAVAEINYAFDVLNADGVVVLTNFDGAYLGDSSFDEVFAELNRRRAVMFIHPTSPACFEKTSLGYLRPMMEFLFDTTRAVVNMVLNGTLRKYPDIRVIVPHAGATLPVLADRVAGIAAALPLGGQEPGEIDVLGTLQGLYYEVGAGYPFPRHIDALLNLVDAGRLLYGTDFPFGPVAGIAANSQALLDTKLLNERDTVGVLRNHALQLFPRLE